jgi:hypothetical protein
MIITDKVAREVIDVMGPCSVASECYEVSDVIKDAEDYKSLKGLLDFYIDIQEIHNERAMEGACHRGDDYHKQVITECDEMVAAINKRAKEFLA